MADYEITTASALLEFDAANGRDNAASKIDDNHFINFWYGGGSFDAYAQVFEVDLGTWAITTANSSLNFESSSNGHNKNVAIDSNHFLNIWRDTSGDGRAQVFTVNTSTWAVTTANSSLEFDTENLREPDLVAVDDNHFIAFWGGSAGRDGYAQVLEVNTTTWAVTTAAASLEYDTVDNTYNTACQIDTNHFVNFWNNGTDGNNNAQVFTVNTSTWVITTANSLLAFDTGASAQSQRCYKIDDTHIINFWAGPGNDGYAQVFDINTSTWEVTTAAASLEYDTVGSLEKTVQQIDDNHFILFWNFGAGYCQVLEVNTSTWVITTAAARFTFSASASSIAMSAQKIDDSHYVNFFADSSFDGIAQVLAVELPTTASTSNFFQLF